MLAAALAAVLLPVLVAKLDMFGIMSRHARVESDVFMLRTAGKNIAQTFLLSNLLRETGEDTDFAKEWEALRDAQPSAYEKKFYDPELWTHIAKLPADPPKNLITFASANIDPLSLRTKLASSDMQKSIRFAQGYKPTISILKDVGVVCYADGGCLMIFKRRPDSMKYEYVYGGQPFNLATNLVDGAQIKYIAPGGKEVIPGND
jgi:hypothetical protein